MEISDSYGVIYVLIKLTTWLLAFVLLYVWVVLIICLDWKITTKKLSFLSYIIW